VGKIKIKKMIENIKEHLSDYKWIYIITIVLLSLIGWWIWYEYAYPCVYGHYEEQWQQTYIYAADGSMTPMGGYWQDVFICDCRTVRDSVSDAK
jgi:hypothetical protein